MTGLHVLWLGFERGGRRPLGLTCGRRLRHGKRSHASVRLNWQPRELRAGGCGKPSQPDVERLTDAHGPDANLSAHLYATALRNEAEGSVHD